MAVTEGISLLVAHGFQELVDPNGSINREALAVQCGQIGGPRAGLNDLPKALNTHLGECLSRWSEDADWVEIPSQGKMNSFSPAYEPHASNLVQRKAEEQNSRKSSSA